jgi:hypothetical protein
MTGKRIADGEVGRLLFHDRVRHDTVEAAQVATDDVWASR